MLQRTLEPEVMDAPDEADLYDAMDHDAVNQQFVRDLVAGGAVGPNVLDLGTGPAAIPILLCEAQPQCRVVGVDASPSMLHLARHNVINAGYELSIQLELTDAKVFEWNDDLFHTLISNSLIHHVANPETVVDSVTQWLQPGGRVFIRDLVRPDDEATIEHWVAKYAGNEPEYCQQLLRQSFHAALTLGEMRELVARSGADPQCVMMTSDRHWTWDAVLPIT